MCKNNCSYNGICSKGQCICKEPFIEADCSVNKTEKFLAKIKNNNFGLFKFKEIENNLSTFPLNVTSSKENITVNGIKTIDNYFSLRSFLTMVKYYIKIVHDYLCFCIIVFIYSFIK